VAHQLRHKDLNTDVCLPGDQENHHLGDERGTEVGDNTAYPIVSATLQMVALDEEAETMLRAEAERLAKNNGSMNPVDQLPVNLQQLLGVGRDDYDDRYLPGFPGTPRPVKQPEPQLAAGKGPAR
jgi:hypothetical protein